MIENEQEYHEKRQYFALIEEVGSWNRYQLYMFLIFSMVNIFDSALMFIPPLLFYHANYQCQGSSGDACNQFVCSLNPIDRKQYLSEAPFHSLAQEFSLDFQCEHASTITLFSTLMFVGIIGGMLLFSPFTEHWGRKKSLLISLAILIGGLSLTLLSGYFKSIPLIICAILLTFCGCENAYQYVYCFATEAVAEEWRITYINALNVIYGFGMVIDALAFFYIKDWATIYLFVFLIPAVITIIAVIFMIEETPMNMLASMSDEKILERLRRIADINGKQFTITIEEISHLKSDYQYSVDHAAHQSFTIIDLFGYKSLRKTIVPLMVFNFTVNYLFFSPSIINNSISDDLFSESIIEGLSYSTSVIAIHFFLEHVKRRKMNFIISLMMLILLCLLLLEDQDKQSNLYSVFYFAYRFSVSMAFLAVYLMNYESFPTQIRAVGATLGYLFGNTSGLIQPHIVSAWNHRGWNVLYSLIVVCALGFIPNLFLKETFKVPPPEIIEELEPSYAEQQENKEK